MHIFRNAFQFEKFPEHLCCADVVFTSTANHDVLICVSRINILVFPHSFFHRCKITIGVHIAMGGLRKFVVNALEALLCNMMLPQGQNVGIFIFACTRIWPYHQVCSMDTCCIKERKKTTENFLTTSTGLVFCLYM